MSSRAQQYLENLKSEKNAALILEDGTVLYGTAFGDTTKDKISGEVVFNTSMTGYQEVLTDPSYCGQIVTMTYPLIGNYGLNAEDIESMFSKVNGFIVKENCNHPSNWRAVEDVNDFLKAHNVIGIAGIDTRLLTRKIRVHGTLKGMITTNIDADINNIVDTLNNTEYPTDQVSKVSTKSIFRSPGQGYRVVLIDMGTKQGIHRELIKRNCDVTVVPYDTTYEQITRLQPEGIMISNGPGDPKNVLQTAEMLKPFIGKIPMYGICLGHQLIALSAGADTEKLKFGHRGGNNPVKDLRTNRVYITSQNHGYTVNKESLEGTGLTISHINLNDDTVEGLVHESGLLASVQYHPEAAPGPLDSNYLFDQFIDTIKTWKTGQER
ncbi:carbamoyl phosphate synthase small subunit [Desulfuribacillus alkaliarsenatis]|uniref:Carbamoyl phosphate synthase small chain n=1 Tax=Desulfuribacillus alkaliarsenatis TaxID=766136 RepID=A0A1E5G006_9FIRM|nr:carbamoyl phosphate synthase small subunit [Desulfuribacillus alkaliarsenatis]